MGKHPYAVPTTVLESAPTGEHTKPWELLDRAELNSEELEVVQRSRRDSSDPATYADIVKLTARVMRKELDERSEERRQLESARELLDRPPRAVVAQVETDHIELKRSMTSFAADIAELQRGARFLKWIGGTVLTIALGSVGVGLGALWARAAHEGETAAEIRRLKEDVQQLLRDERPSRSQSTKDPQP